MFLAHLLYEVVAQQAAGLAAGTAFTRQIETAHHVLVGELLRQSGKALVGPLATLTFTLASFNLLSK